METQESLTRHGEAPPPADHATCLVSTLKWLLAGTIPSGTGYWELTCHVERNGEGCTDIHVHTCTRRKADKPASTEAPALGGYL